MTEREADHFTETLRSGATAVGVSVSDAQVAQCLAYTERLLATNEHTNLTRIVEPEAVAVKHFVDSLTILNAVPELAQGAFVADVGTGAGFPGLVLKIVRPDLRLTLLDSLGKRLTFLQEVVTELGFGDNDIALIHARAEEAGRDPGLRDQFDLVTARAVASLPVLLEWCTPLVRQGGRFVAMKSANVDEERDAAGEAARLLQVRLVADRSVTLPAITSEADSPDATEATRRLLVYAKLRPTPNRFPRRTAEIKANPL